MWDGAIGSLWFIVAAFLAQIQIPTCTYDGGTQQASVRVWVLDRSDGNKLKICCPIDPGPWEQNRLKENANGRLAFITSHSVNPQQVMLHYDDFQIIVVCLQGRKRWLILAPQDAPHTIDANPHVNMLVQIDNVQNLKILKKLLFET